MTAGAAPVLAVEELLRRYPVAGGLFGKARHVQALDGVSLAVGARETVAVVGESGCGKSTLARCMLKLEQPDGGRICLRGQDITALNAAEMRPLRRHIQIVFQDPHASLNARWTIAAAIGDALRLHGIGTARDRRDRVAALLERVGLDAGYLDRYPHELSGGQRQRVAIARAIAVEPAIVICDEPVSALDVSIQAQVINLLKRLQRDAGIAYVFISHDLTLVQHISDRIAVMYLGQIVEMAATADMRRARLHPYAMALFSAAPVPDPESPARERRIVLSGDLPSPISPPSGCRFHTRCPFAKARCRAEVPELRAIEGRLVRCHFAGEIEAPA